MRHFTGDATHNGPGTVFLALIPDVGACFLCVGFPSLETHTPKLSSCVLGMLEYEGVVCCRVLSAGGVFNEGPEVVNTGCAPGFRVSGS